MKKANLFTNLSPVKFLVSGLFGLLIVTSAFAQTANSMKTKLQKQNYIVQDYIFSATTLIARSTSLVDHNDGTRTDGMDYGLFPALKMPIGLVTTKVIYSQNLNDMSPNESGFSDIPVTFAFNAFKSKVFTESSFSWTPSFTAVAPISKESVKRDNLQGILSTGISFGFIPNISIFNAGYGWNFGASVSLGRYFHPYEEDINGSVLNQYSSNQTINAIYKYRSWNFSVEFIHKNRWSYQNNLKESFEQTEEISYGFSENFSVAIGHSNAGSALKANGIDSNYELINENDSKIYGQVAVSF